MSDASLRASLAANERWARCGDRTAATQAARDAQWRRLEDEVDPDRVLDASERHKRATNLFRAQQQRRALRSAAARKARNKGKVAG